MNRYRRWGLAGAVTAVTWQRAELPEEDPVRAGADGFIANPYHYADLIELARNLLARSAKL